MATQIDARQAQIDALLDEVVLARIATAKNNRPHVVPVWFLWDGESVWISAFSSTRKIKDLLANPYASILIEPKQVVDGQIQAVLFEGKAELVYEPRQWVEEISTRIYTRYLGPEGVLAADPQSWIRDPENYLIKLTPAKTFTW